jgi:transmembrane protein EpsG
LLATIFLGFFSVFFSYLAKYKDGEWGLKVSFLFICLFLALRHDFGNDYVTYLNLFYEFSSLEDYDFTNPFSLFYEPGWVVLNFLFQSLGFFSMKIFLALLSCVVYYRFVVKYIPKNLYWLAVFIYVFTPSFLLLQSTAMRQSVGVMIFIFSIDYLIKKRFLPYLLLILLASLFHYSAIFLIFVYPLIYFNKKIQILSGVFLILSYFLLFLLSKNLAPLFKDLLLNLNDKYSAYTDQGSVNSGFGFIYFTFLLVILLFNDKNHTKEIGLISKISILSFFIIPFGLIIEMSGRFAMYLSPTVVVIYPNLVNNFKAMYVKTLFVVILIIFTFYQFFSFFYSKTYFPYFFEYQTIFSSAKWL